MCLIFPMKSANRLEQVFGIKFQQISQACTTNVVEKRNCAIFIPSCSLATLSAYPSFFLFNPCQPSRIKEQGVVDGLGEGGAWLFMNRVLCSDGGSFPFHPSNIPPLFPPPPSSAASGTILPSPVPSHRAPVMLRNCGIQLSKCDE